MYVYIYIYIYICISILSPRAWRGGTGGNSLPHTVAIGTYPACSGCSVVVCLSFFSPHSKGRRAYREVHWPLHSQRNEGDPWQAEAQTRPPEIHIHICIYIYIYICTHVDILITVISTIDDNIYIYICTDIYIYIYIERERERGERPAGVRASLSPTDDRLGEAVADLRSRRGDEAYTGRIEIWNVLWHVVRKPEQVCPRRTTGGSCLVKMCCVFSVCVCVFVCVCSACVVVCVLSVYVVVCVFSSCYACLARMCLFA